ncbi:MAG TPA: leucyl aminopeptidase [Acidimicrobiales bacterium]|nr:leucyl aminopeptidase [Acidimicrobiales bacterium]
MSEVGGGQIVASFSAGRDVPAEADVLGVPVFDDLSTPPGAGAAVDRRFLAQRRFEGKPGQAQALLADDGTTVVALGVGARGSAGRDELRRAAAALARNAGAARHVATTLVAASGQAHAAAVVEGFALGAYRYCGRPADHPPVEQVTVVGAVDGDVRRGRVAAVATCRARDWVNRPARDLTPRQLSRLAAEAAGEVGVDVDVWAEDRIGEERLGGLLGVASGAAEPPRVIRLAHRPPGAPARVHVVGKGITFDSGGLSLKPAQSMMTMKDDMGGAAAAICATLAAAELGVPVEVVCWVGATENMPSGTAIRPGDVLTARNGTTIEVLNTDAEGRLVLADMLSLAVEERPDAIVDVATLTGGQRVALGPGVAAVMGTDAGLVAAVRAAGEAAGEPAWELPLHGPYRKKLDSDVADLKNVTGGPAASTIMAGLFLREFAGDVPWAHLDIADPSWSDSDEGWLTRGATGWGARTLLELLCAWPADRRGRRAASGGAEPGRRRTARPGPKRPG